MNGLIRVRVPLVSDQLCEMGRFGQKTGAGWYKYDENRRAIPDPEVAALIEKTARAAGVERRGLCAEPDDAEHRPLPLADPAAR